VTENGEESLPRPAHWVDMAAGDDVLPVGRRIDLAVPEAGRFA
jgi:hypothetical protein